MENLTNVLFNEKYENNDRVLNDANDMLMTVNVASV
jgi:hypothetical protein